MQSEESDVYASDVTSLNGAFESITFGDDFETMDGAVEKEANGSSFPHRFCLASQVKISVRVKIRNLFGFLDALGSEEDMSRWIVQIDLLQLYTEDATSNDDGFKLQPTLHTRPLLRKNLTNGWNEWLHLSLRYADVHELHRLRITLQKWPQPGDIILKGYFSLVEETLINDSSASTHYRWSVRQGTYRIPLGDKDPKTSGGMTERLEKFIKEYEAGHAPMLEWLDRLTFKEIGRIVQREASENGSLSLIVEFIRFDLPLYLEKADKTSLEYSTADWPNYTEPVSGSLQSKLMLEKCLNKYRQLNYSIQKAGPCTKPVIPLRATREYITDLLKTPPIADSGIVGSAFSLEERALLWKYRYWLSGNPAGLVPFLCSLDWDDPDEIAQVITILIPTWRPLSHIDQIVELISLRLPTCQEDRLSLYRHLVFQGLSNINYEQLSLHLVVFIEGWARLAAIEEYDETLILDADQEDDKRIVSVSTWIANKFLLSRALEDPERIGCRMYWQLRISARKSEPQARLLATLMRRLGQTGKVQWVEVYLAQERLMSALSNLVHSAKNARKSLKAASTTSLALSSSVSSTSSPVQQSASNTRSHKIDLIRNHLRDPAHRLAVLPNPTNPLPLPLNPSILVTGLNPERLSIFKSNAMPVQFSFIQPDFSQYLAIFKTGDDLRQDQMVLNMVELCDQIWKNMGLNLRMTPYRVLPISLQDGLVEFVESESLASILERFNGNIRSYFRYLSLNKRSSKSDKGISAALSDTEMDEERFGRSFDSLPIDPEIMENYICSCAGYSLLTHLLGIGDRHLENLLLTADGRLFHIDFAYCFGRDPKPFPPPMKLCREMVEAMGGGAGTGSVQFARFRELILAAYVILRRNARYLLSLLQIMLPALMDDQQNLAGQGTTSQQASKSEIVLPSQRAIAYVRERLALDRSDEAALEQFEQLIEDSVHALFPQVMEAIHKWAQYWRK